MREGTRQAHIDSVRAAIAFLRERLDSDADLAETAEVACMAPHHFHRVFKRLTGRGEAEHRRKLRLLRAAFALLGGEPVGRIAQRAGYSDGDTFRRAFKAEFGLTPRAYRKLKRSKDMGNPMEGVAVGFIKVPVGDFARACAFYRDSLGLTEDFAVEAFGWAQYSSGSVPICLYKEGMGGGEGKPGGETGIQLRVKDAAAAHEHLKLHAGKLTTGDDGTITFAVTDPDGNTLQIAQVG